MQVDFDRYGLRIDGQRQLIRSGSLQYFRLPSHELWRDRLDKMRGAGLNAVEVVYPWSYHSAARGDIDFSGVRDVAVLHEMIEEAGLFLIARPGPFVGADLDLGGQPAWLLEERGLILRCRERDRFAFSVEYLEAVEEWFGEVVPRILGCSKLVAVQIENEYSLPAPFSRVPIDLWDLAVRWLGTGASVRRWLGSPTKDWCREAPASVAREAGTRAQGNAYMRKLQRGIRDLGVEVPILHNDLSREAGRQTDVDILALDRYPLGVGEADVGALNVFEGDEIANDAGHEGNPVVYAQLQSGRHDAWSGPGYERVRKQLGSEAVVNMTKSALGQRGTWWNYSVFNGGTNWGYMGSSDVYTSYDCGAPIGEDGGIRASYESVRRLNEFIDRFSDDLVRSDVVDYGLRGQWCDEHVVTREGRRGRRFVFLRNPGDGERTLPTPERERSQLAPGETQIRVYNPGRAPRGREPRAPAMEEARVEYASAAPATRVLDILGRQPTARSGV